MWIEDFRRCDLPARRTGAHLKTLGKQSFWRILAIGLMVYSAFALAFSLVDYASLLLGRPLVQSAADATPASFPDIVYFNFITILTIGYGDFVPLGPGRALAVLEAVLGTGLMGILIAALTAKFLSAPRNSVVFSRFAYYCVEPQCFLIVYVNTSVDRIVNAETSCYFKLGGDWDVDVPVRSPFITQAVQTVYVHDLGHDDIVARLKKRDALRVAIGGQICGTAFATSIQYSADEIIVLPNRQPLVEYDGFWEPDFASVELAEMFHYRPPDAPTLAQYVQNRRNEADAAA